MSQECWRDATESVELNTSGGAPAAARCWFNNERRYCSPAWSSEVIEQPVLVLPPLLPEGGATGCGDCVGGVTGAGGTTGGGVDPPVTVKLATLRAPSNACAVTVLNP